MERITVDPNRCHGKPCVCGTRIMVEQVLELLEAGKSFEDIRTRYYPALTDEDIQACIRFAKQLVANEDIHLANESMAS